MIVRLSKQKLLDVAFSKTSLRQKSVRISEQGRKILLVMGSDYPAVEASFVSVEETTKQNLEDSDLAQSIEYMILDCMEIEYEEVLPAQKKKLELAARKIIKKLLG